LDDDGAIIEFHLCTAIHKYWCTTDELGESWAVKIDFIVKGCNQLIEKRGVDVGHEILYIFDNPAEIKIFESGDNRTLWRRWMLTFPVRVGLRG